MMNPSSSRTFLWTASFDFLGTWMTKQEIVCEIAKCWNVCVIFSLIYINRRSRFLRIGIIWENNTWSRYCILLIFKGLRDIYTYCTRSEKLKSYLKLSTVEKKWKEKKKRKKKRKKTTWLKRQSITRRHDFIIMIIFNKSEQSIVMH